MLHRSCPSMDLVIRFLLVAIEDADPSPVPTKIKKYAKKYLSWEEVRALIIKQSKSLKYTVGSVCSPWFILESGHEIENCLLNPFNSNKELSLSSRNI